MGCDIHLVVEGRNDKTGPWVGLWSSGVRPQNKAHFTPTVTERDYTRFIELANVRGESKTGHAPRGLPSDISPLTRFMTEYWSKDGHSHSWLTAEEFIAACERALKNWRKHLGANVDKQHWENFAMWELLGVDNNVFPNTEFRVVFWFDN